MPTWKSILTEERAKRSVKSHLDDRAAEALTATQNRWEKETEEGKAWRAKERKAVFDDLERRQKSLAEKRKGKPLGR